MLLFIFFHIYNNKLRFKTHAFNIPEDFAELKLEENELRNWLDVLEAYGLIAYSKTTKKNQDVPKTCLVTAAGYQSSDRILMQEGEHDENCGCECHDCEDEEEPDEDAIAKAKRLARN